MKKIKRVGRIQPRGQLVELGLTVEQFNSLRDGLTIEVEDSLFDKMTGVTETKETLTQNVSSYSKPSKKKHTYSKTKHQPQVDAENAEANDKPEKLSLSEEYKSFQTEDE